ncbi:MAG: site-specific DNA-methyltransferase [Anaerovoracaceae bacterium]
MDKLKMQTANKADGNFKKLAAMFPNAVTETIDENGEVVRAIDKDVLMQEISCKVVDGNEERYQFTWPDKKKSVLLANAPIKRTLRPCREESVDFDNTENLYIEGDNLEVLKLLQETYLGKIKMIYIDPPYNTGNDFVYEDDFAQSTEEYLENSGQYDDEGNRLIKNLDSNGRFHTDWLNMIYPRLKLAKDLLTNDGVIFISIDDNEVENLRKCCDELFSEENFIACFCISSNSSKNNSKYVSVSHEYLLCYVKNKKDLSDNWKVKKSGVDEFQRRAKQLVKKGLSKEDIHNELLELVRYPRFYELDHYTYADDKGVYQTNDPGGVPNGNKMTEIIHPETGKPCAKPSGGWRYKEEEIKRKISNNEFEFGKDETIIPRPKRYIDDFIYSVPKSVVFFDSQGSTKWMKSVGIPFDFPKATELIKWVVSMYPCNDCYVLDFFSGSATTAHAVMQLNAEDGCNRKFIMVQLPEETAEKSEAYKAGYKNICEIGKERIRRAAKKIAEENPEAKFDGGFRVLKCDSSNMKEVYYNPAEYELSLFGKLEDNIKEDRTPEDLLFQVMLDLGVLLSSKIAETTIAGKKVFNVEDNYLIACFDDNVTEDVITEIAKQKPYYFVMRDSSMANDSVATNFEQIFATYSPETVRKVL